MPSDLDSSSGGKRRTMVKDRVGCVRTSTRNLPRGHFTYGMKYSPDAEGAGDGMCCANHIYVLGPDTSVLILLL